MWHVHSFSVQSGWICFHFCPQILEVNAVVRTPCQDTLTVIHILVKHTPNIMKVLLKECICKRPRSYLLQCGLGGVLLRVKSGMVGSKRQNWKRGRRQQARVFNYKQRGRKMRVALLMSSSGRWKKKKKNFFPLHFCLFQLGSFH